ncbi:MAG: PorP/SprF family type IX secretion system membrane protein, partial [Ginsengibacter sp.]
MKKSICVALLLMVLTSVVRAQDPHFSQFFASPLTLNPALTGKFDGTFRVAGNYRNQWPAFNNVYTTSTISLDFPIMQKRLPDFDTWGVGILALTDKAAGGVLTNNYLGVSTSYHKALNENGYSQLGVGFQATYGQKKLDNSKLVFEDQLTPFGFTGVSADIFNTNDLEIKTVDVNAGLIFTTSTTDLNNFYLGASIYHINKPKESFKGGNWNLSPRTTISGGGYFPVTDLLTLHTSGIFQMQNKTSELTVGGALAASLNKDDETPTNVYAGAWFRLNDALIPYIALEFNSMRIGASYDVNVSSLKSGSQSRGGMEVSVIYIKRPPNGRNI